MPRQHIYMTQKTLNGVRKLVEERRSEGASAAEANISSVCAELLTIGLRVTEQLKAKEQVSTDVSEDKDGMYRELLLSEVIKSRQASQAILKCIFNIEEIKKDTRLDFSELKKGFEAELISLKGGVFK
ncbi:conjugal transfer protein TraM [Salmonella enterica subsp. enterica serovar Newport]|nr:conjugal transfer protein TraM [Salmonella enterica subsp. enterica serovar Newport]EBW9942041.1 conjugal transfer protein TraM [Salmonella enterica subsp. enterica serovar Give]ECD3768673.1 conjugal transfer protein TraM [Salmonella enterica subsp. enterica serovar Onderstepoort]HAU3020503.1 conjugal transfer protein TraM [Salmonella enterica]EBS2390393.1 conjugal transfer protein TraM [Salmonella enterica subsp. enterica serovar Newport]